MDASRCIAKEKMDQELREANKASVQKGLRHLAAFDFRAWKRGWDPNVVLEFPYGMDGDKTKTTEKGLEAFYERMTSIPTKISKMGFKILKLESLADPEWVMLDYEQSLTFLNGWQQVNRIVSLFQFKEGKVVLLRSFTDPRVLPTSSATKPALPPGATIPPPAAPPAAPVAPAVTPSAAPAALPAPAPAAPAAPVPTAPPAAPSTPAGANH